MMAGVGSDLLAVALGVAALPVAAPTPEQRYERGRAMLRAAGVGQNCRNTGFSDDIVVCARIERLPQVIEPATPPVIALPPGVALVTPTKMVGVGITVRACILQKCPKPLMPDIDFRKLAVAAPGSDADLIAQGAVRAR